MTTIIDNRKHCLRCNLDVHVSDFTENDKYCNACCNDIEHIKQVAEETPPPKRQYKESVSYLGKNGMKARHDKLTQKLEDERLNKEFEL